MLLCEPEKMHNVISEVLRVLKVGGIFFADISRLRSITRSNEELKTNLGSRYDHRMSANFEDKIKHYFLFREYLSNLRKQYPSMVVLNRVIKKGVTSSILSITK